MSVGSVKNKIQQLTTDGMFDANDVKEAVDAAGKKVSAGEMAAIKDAVLGAENAQKAALQPGDSFDPSGYDTTNGALGQAQEMGINLPILNGKLVKLESIEEATAVRGTSFGGTDIPQAVQDVLAKAFDKGVEPFDVTATKRNNETGESKGVFSHYPSMSAPVGNMAFSHTEITPQALEADMNDNSEYNVITSRRTLGPGGQSMTEIGYEKRTGGTGNVSSHYDEGIHEDLYARGSQGQKWANNFAILSDGSIHALPAARRDETGRVILTNPALARGKRVLFMGHLNIRGGVVQNVEMSGRLCRLAGKGEQKFIDPVSILDAWGFEMSPSLQSSSERGGGVQFSNTSDGKPFRDVENGLIGEPR